jgi:ATP synthase protein I
LKDDLDFMLKKMIVIDASVGLILAALVYLIFKEYTVVFLAGYILACLNLFFSSVIAKYAFYGDHIKSQGILLISSGFKVLLVSIVGVLIFKYKNVYVFPYLIGYTCHFISIMIYGLNKKNF